MSRSEVFFYTPFGVKRREAILDLLKEGGSIHVNRKYCPILKRDPDLRYLLKKGKVVRFREPTGQKFGKTGNTAIRLA